MNFLEFLTNDKILVAVISAITTILVTFGGIYLKYILDNNKLSKNYFTQKEAEIELKIKNFLNDTRESVNADRLCIYEFYNRDFYDLNRKHIKNISLTHEVVGEGISKLTKDEQNVPITKYIYVLDSLLKTKKPLYIKVNEQVDYGLKYTLSSQGVLGVLFIPMITLSSNFLGFCRVDYLRNENNFKEEDLVFIESRIKTIVGYIENYYKKN
jgi:hypothetical protein